MPYDLPVQEDTISAISSSLTVSLSRRFSLVMALFSCADVYTSSSATSCFFSSGRVPYLLG